jgi:hypothetical protein
MAYHIVSEDDDLWRRHVHVIWKELELKSSIKVRYYCLALEMGSRLSE